MKDSIYTIPVSEVFEPMEGCPLCQMRDRLEKRCVEYIMGAAMMEPDVRQETNRTGFCAEHFARMLPRNNRLSIGLMLQSHLDYIKAEIISPKPPVLGRAKPRAKLGGCYVCTRTQQAMERMVDNTLGIWIKEESFRTLFAKQQFICFSHYTLLADAAQVKMNKKQYPLFLEVISSLTLQELNSLKEDIDSFCNLFDYRAPVGAPTPETVRNSPERTAQFLTSRPMEQQ